MDQEQKKHLLYDEETSSHDEETLPLPRQNYGQISSKSKAIFLIILSVSVAINMTFMSVFFIIPTRTVVDYATHNLGLAQDVLEMQRWRFTAYSHSNDTIRNAAWDSIDVDRTIVAVDHEEAVALGLEPSAKFPWDEKKDMYALSAFHQLHCMKLIYRSLEEAHNGKPFTNGYSHILHCVDAIRGDLECMADDHLWTVRDGYNPPINEGQMMQCRDFKKLDAWAHEHHSCFKYDYINDAVPPTPLHQFRNCPEGSPYISKMHEHFGYDENWVPDFLANHGPEFPVGNEDRVDHW